VNLHASLLPKHRGASPISSAILAGDEVAGICTMLMDRGLDTGDILMCREIHVDEDDTAGRLHDKLLEPGAELVVETLRLMRKGAIRPVPQDDSKATHTSLVSKKDGKIDWCRDADYLSRQWRTRAYCQYPRGRNISGNSSRCAAYKDNSGSRQEKHFRDGFCPRKTAYNR
jgi:methionyl-tRNA formyltransferase